MLDSLLDIEIAYSLLRESLSVGEKDPMDVHYEKLKASIEVLRAMCLCVYVRVFVYNTTHARICMCISVCVPV